MLKIARWLTLGFLLLLLGLTACQSNNNQETDPNAPNTTNPDQSPRTRVAIHTRLGDMVVELFNETPKHRDNFLRLVKEGFYEDLLIHRVQSNFMLQGGDPLSRDSVPPEQYLGQDTTKRRIEAEINEQFILRQGALCGFHSGEGAHPDKSSHYSQFMLVHGQAIRAYQLEKLSLENNMDYNPDQVQLYENYGGLPQYDGRYTIFGQVVEGMHVLDKIVKVKTWRTENAQWPDRPKEDIRLSMEVLPPK